MHTLTQAQAQQALLLHANNNTLTPTQITQALNNASVTFASILYVTAVQLAAAHKAQHIQKVTRANVMLACTLQAQTNLYARAVRRSAAKVASNNPVDVAAFTAQQNYFTHTATHCIVQHSVHVDKFYLYAIYNAAASVYMHNNAVVSKQHVAAYCTASAAKTLLQESNTVVNKQHNITHSVHVRTIALSNIVSMNVRKQLLTV